MNSIRSQYLDNISKVNFYHTTFYSDKFTILNRWIFSYEKGLDSDSMSNEPYFTPEGNICKEQLIWTNINTKLNTEEKKWYYYISDVWDHNNLPNYFESKIDCNDDMTISALSSIYSDRVKEMNFLIFSLTPVKVWINNELVYQGNPKSLNNYSFFWVTLKKGLNTVFVEKPSFRQNRFFDHYFNSFFLSYKPAGFLNNSKLINKKETILLKNQLDVILEKHFLKENEACHIKIIPKNLTNSNSGNYLINVYDSTNSLVTYRKVKERENLLLPVLPKGIYKIEVTESNGFKKEESYFTVGYFNKNDFSEFTTGLEEEYGTDNNINSISSFFPLQNIDNGYFYKGGEYCYRDYILELLGKVYLLSQGKERISKDDYILQRNSGLISFKSCTGEGRIISWLCLPKNFKKGKKYSLVVNLYFGINNSQYPDVPFYARKEQSSNAITVGICGRGAISKDFINEYEILSILDWIQKNYSIDRSKIHCIGVCSGSMKSFDLSKKVPHIFSTITAITGTALLDLNNPDYSDFKNISNTPVFTLCNIEDFAFNPSRVLSTAKNLNKSKEFIYNGFTHIEFEKRLNSLSYENFILKHKLDLYPKKIDFKVSTNVYYRSYWLKVTSVEGNNCNISGTIENSRNIRIRTTDVNSLEIFISRKDQNIRKKILININETQRPVLLPDYGKVICKDINSNSPYVDILPMSKIEYENIYNNFIPSLSEYGLKQIYLENCKVIQPDHMTEEDSIFVNTLGNPIKNKIRDYKRLIIREENVEVSTFENSNIIYLIDAKNQTEKTKEILTQFNFNLDENSISLGDIDIKGHFACSFISENPFGKNNLVKFVIFNNGGIKSKLVNLYEKFDEEKCFNANGFVLDESGLSMLTNNLKKKCIGEN